MIPGYILSAFPHRQFHTLPCLLDSWAALPNSYPNALRAMQGGGAVCTIFMMVFGMTRPRGELTTYRARGGSHYYGQYRVNGYLTCLNNISVIMHLIEYVTFTYSLCFIQHVMKYFVTLSNWISAFFNYVNTVICFRMM